MTPRIVLTPELELFSSGMLELPVSILSVAKSKFWQFPRSKNMGVLCGYPVALFCESCGKTHDISHNCMRRECVTCGEGWQYRLGRKAGLRLWSARIKKFGLGRGRLLHITVSPDPDIVPEVMTAEWLRKARTECKDLCKRHGIVGACQFNHPERHGKEGLHFHINGFAPGNILPGGQVEDNGWVFKIIKDKEHEDYKGFRSVRSVMRCIGYELGHSGISEGIHALSWWGEFGYNNLSQQVLISEFAELYKEFDYRRTCPFCGSESLRLANVIDWTSHDIVGVWSTDCG